LSELQIALIALAVLALLALFLGEKWQEQRRLRQLRERLHGGVGDALLQAGAGSLGEVALRSPGAAEPVFARDAGPPAAGARGTAPAAGPGPAPERGAAWTDQGARSADGPALDRAADPAGLRDGVFADASVSSEPLVAPTLLLRPDWAEDPLLDCSLEVCCTRAVDGVRVIEAAARLLHAPWKLPVHFVVWDGRYQQWVLPDRFGYYTNALASIQLANRRACVDASQIDRFVAAVQELAQALDADVDLPDTARLVAQGAELDRLCARYDIRIGLTVESTGTSWTGPQLRTAAQDCGFVAIGNQRWVQRLAAPAAAREDAALDAGEDEGAALPDASEELDLYTLQADPADMRRLVLEFDIARAPVAAQAFAAMVEHAWALAQALGGRVVDDHGRPIDDRSVQTVEAQLAQVFAEMRAAGIEPGSTRARRLYS
jgi:hypothetical protein